MRNIHFTTNGQVGINLSAEELPNGDLKLLRIFQTPYSDKSQAPQCFTIYAGERDAVMKYLMEEKKD